MYVILNSTSPLLCRQFVKQVYPVGRHISLLKQIPSQSVLLDKSKHRIIYEFPYIRQTAYIIRSKIWVPALMTLITPVGLLVDGIRIAVLGGLIASWLHFIVVHFGSLYMKNIIGKIYINKGNECNDVIISSLNSKGGRVDRSYKPGDLVVCDFSSKFSLALGFVTIFAQNTNIVYKMNFFTSKIHNPEAFTKLFGETNWNFKKKEEKTV